MWERIPCQGFCPGEPARSVPVPLSLASSRQQERCPIPAASPPHTPHDIAPVIAGAFEKCDLRVVKGAKSEGGRDGRALDRRAIWSLFVLTIKNTTEGLFPPFTVSVSQVSLMVLVRGVFRTNGRCVVFSDQFQVQLLSQSTFTLLTEMLERVCAWACVCAHLVVFHLTLSFIHLVFHGPGAHQVDQAG